jgi:hypothetical protein
VSHWDVHCPCTPVLVPSPREALIREPNLPDKEHGLEIPVGY